VAVERPHAEPGVVGDVLDGHLHAVSGEELARAGDEPLAVAARIPAQGLDGTHRRSMPEAERRLRLPQPRARAVRHRGRVELAQTAAVPYAPRLLGSQVHLGGLSTARAALALQVAGGGRTRKAP
jgi:hypothetical protein